MENTLLNEQEGAQQLLKVTALEYLKDALAAQEYEVCPQLIDIAKNAGTQDSDIKAVIADYLKSVVPGRPRLRTFA